MSISTSWSNREKSSDADRDNLDPLFHSANENFHDQAFGDSDEEESSGRGISYVALVLNLLLLAYRNSQVMVPLLAAVNEDEKFMELYSHENQF